jgi:hypothetical protein
MGGCGVFLQWIASLALKDRSAMEYRQRKYHPTSAFDFLSFRDRISFERWQAMPAGCSISSPPSRIR